MNKILQMLELQQELNDATNGKDWENGLTKNGKKIDWRRCIYLEAAELIESYPWKHWKNIDASPDYDNIKIEIVDIWHFIMSEALRLYKIENKGSIADIAQAIIRMQGFTEFQQTQKTEKLDPYDEIKLVEEMIKILFCNDNIDTLVISFLTMASKLNLKLPELYSLYIGKNILNKFRQKNGYKEGSYIKVWNNKEDNLIMQELLANKNDISPKELYTALEKAYPKA
ncbi:MAG: Dimeric dUTPase (EC [uncultured Sulfurovum sp.]|uniref:Dimeric dUTPase (EC) n=1 Tax=uncultured Sulfurovum sp. TaxID=269237 RepID=A0A6S6THV5_9BACT|nr:MAG: Dimeric dUTPase (EC [uncultured Sulfurovum sp.]